MNTVIQYKHLNQNLIKMYGSIYNYSWQFDTFSYYLSD